MKCLTGKEIHLGKKMEDKIETASIESMSNDNTQYLMSLTKTDGFSEDFSSTALYVDGNCAQFGSGVKNTNAEKCYGIWARYISETATDAFSRYLGVKPRLRHHPHHELLVKFVPSKDKFKASEPLAVTLQIKNVGKAPVRFSVGGKGGPERDTQFGFTAHGKKVIPDSGNPDVSPDRAGGLGHLLKPGEVFEKEVDLGKWFKLEKNWFPYEITGTYDLEFLEPEGKDQFIIWEDYAGGRFFLNVEGGPFDKSGAFTQ